MYYQRVIIAEAVHHIQNENYPDVVEGDEQKMTQHELARRLLVEVKDRLADYDLKTSSSKSHSGNRSMNDIYVVVDQDLRDEVIMEMWKILNYLRNEYVVFLQEWKPDRYREHPNLEEKIVEITKQR